MVTETEPTPIKTMVAVTNGRSLHRKLAQVMYEVDRIPKRGKAPAAMGGFAFVQVGDAADVIRKALAEQNVSMLPSAIELIGEAEHDTKSGGTMTTMTVRTTWTLTDGETGEIAVIQSMGSGADTGDKAAPKAQSNAMKYALLMGFLLSTGDDPELSDSSDRRPKQDGGQLPAMAPTGPDRPPLVRTTGNDGLIGKVATSGTSDFNLRQTPDGAVLPFRIKEGNKAGQIVIAHDDLANALAPFRDSIMGTRATVWGTYTDEESPPKADGYVVRYKVLHLSRIQTEDWTLPADLETRREPTDANGAATVPVGAANDGASMPAVPSGASLGDETSAPALFPDDDLSDLPGYS